MQELIDQLNEPEIHFPGNFDTPKQANALLMCLCQEATGAINAQAAEIDELNTVVANIDAMLSISMDECAKLKSLCDQMGESLNDAATSLETIAMRSYGDDSYINTMHQVRGYASSRASVARKDLEAWRAMK